MSDPIVESQATPEVQEAAEKMGWIPPTRFHGDPEKFIDADLYIERGETVLPIVKEQNKRLQNEVATLRAQTAATAAALTKAQQTIDQLQEHHSVALVKAAEKARMDLKVQLAAASEAGDHEGVAELTDQLTKLNTAERQSEKVQPKAEVVPPKFVPEPELVEWQEENSWFGQDKAKTGMALGIGTMLREEGDTSTGRKFYDKITARMEKMLSSGDETPIRSKVEGARNGGDEERRPAGRGAKGYASLPKEAKDQCDADIRNFVGPGKKYKTADEWRTRYASIYFEQ